MKKTICDRCGKDVPDKLEFPVYGIAVCKARDYAERLDLCPECLSELSAWFKSNFKEASVDDSKKVTNYSIDKEFSIEANSYLYFVRITFDDGSKSDKFFKNAVDTRNWLSNCGIVISPTDLEMLSDV